MTAPTRTRTTNAPAASAIGWSKGIACQVNLPNMSVLPSRQHCRVGRGTLRGSGPLTRRQTLLHDVLEESGLHTPVGVGTHVLALPEELAVFGLIQHRTGDTCFSHPLCELLWRHGVHVECHAWKAVAAEVRRKTGVDPGAVGLQVEPGPHAVHGVDHAAQPWHEKHVEDTRRSDSHVKWYPCRNNHAVDARDVLLRVNEQPLPVE